MTSSESEKPGSRFWAIFAAGLPLLGIVLGGTTERWSQGVILILLGLGVLIRPPRHTPGRVTNACLLALVLLAGVQLLPLGDHFHPDWKTRLGPAFAEVLPATLSPQPWVTAEALFLLVAALIWFYWVAALPWSPETRRLALRCYAVGLVLFALSCLYFYWKNSPPDIWHSPRHFGPFPNRNHTGNVLGIGGLLVAVCALDRLRARRWDGWLLLLGLFPIGAALILNYSRGGVLLLLCGLGLWMAGVYLAGPRSWKVLALSVSALLGLLALLLVFGGELTERLIHPPEAQSANPLIGFRALVFKDAFAFGQQTPWTGVGLGNFQALFALYREASASNYRAIHPESDWIWLWAEMGWPGLLCVLGALASLWPRIFPIRRENGWRLRWAAAVGVFAFLVSGWLDVAAHRLGPILPALLLLGMALEGCGASSPRRLTPLLFRLIALLPLALGAYWLQALYQGKSIPGAIGLERARETARQGLVSKNFAATLASTSQALPWAPLDWPLAWQRATANVYLQHEFEALNDFRRVKILQPNRADLRYWEGQLWIDRIPIFALSPWHEALQVEPDEAPHHFTQMLRQTGGLEAIRAQMREWAGKDRRLLLAYLDQISEPELDREIAQLLEADPDLTQFSEAQKSRLFELWAAHDSRHTLAAAIQAHPAWQSAGWPWLARDLARESQFEAAYRLALTRSAKPSFPDYHVELSLPALRRQVLREPTHFGAAYALINAETKAGDPKAAYLVAQRTAALPGAPKYFLYLEAELAAAQEDWPKAWDAMVRYATPRS